MNGVLKGESGCARSGGIGGVAIDVTGLELEGGSATGGVNADVVGEADGYIASSHVVGRGIDGWTVGSSGIVVGEGVGICLVGLGVSP